MIKRNFYEILNSQPNASFDELKANYKQLILQCHPDKLKKDNATVTANVGDVTARGAADNIYSNASATADSFVIINEAWHALKDPARRKIYDAELLLTKFQTHINIFERLTLDDMKRQQTATDDGAGDEDGAEPTTATKTKAQTNTPSWYYTHACRCGGQYIFDESADNVIFSRNRSSNIAVADCDRSGKGDCEVCVDVVANNVASDDDDADNAEVIVECSECSLVIVLARRRLEPQNKCNNNNKS